jgi:TolB-like protein
MHKTLFRRIVALPAFALLAACGSAPSPAAPAQSAPVERPPVTRPAPAPAAPPATAAPAPVTGTLGLDEALEQAARDIAAKLPPGAEIAVVSFDSESPNISDYLMEELDYALLDRGLVVADRAQLAAVRRELEFQVSGEVDDTTAQSIGQFLGVPYTLTGQFVPAGDAYRLRVTTIRVETAQRAAAAAFTVRHDEALQKLLETLKRATINTHSADY